MSTETIELDSAVALHAEMTAIILERQLGSEIDASRLAEAIMNGLRTRYGGEAIYIPKGLSLRDRAARDRDIRARYNGRNMLELCRETGLTRSQIYRILGRQLPAHR